MFLKEIHYLTLDGNDVTKHPVPRLKYESSGPIFPELPNLVVLQDQKME